MKTEIIILTIIIIIIIFSLIKNNYDIIDINKNLNNPPDTVLPPDFILPPDNTIPDAGSFDYTMKLNEINYMLPNSKIVMNTNYIPTDDNDITTKSYVDTGVLNNLPEATFDEKGIIQLAGDLTGSSDLPTIADNVITLEKLAPLTYPNSIIGSDINKLMIEYKLGNELNLSNESILNVVNVVKKVNGVTPDLNGNVNIINGRVITKPLDELPDPSDITLNEGDIFIVSNDSTIENNGRVFIFHSNPTREWIEINPNQAINDSRYLKLSGINNMSNGSKIIMYDNYIPVNDNDIITKGYIDNNLNIPIASDNTKGIIQLAGDLTGTADEPLINDNVITLNKLAPLNNTNSILYSKDDKYLAECKLGNNFSISNSILDIINIIKTINNTSPDVNGDISLPILNILIGTSDDLNNLDIQNIKEGTIFIINGDDNIYNDGRLYIFKVLYGFIEITGNIDLYDTRYLQLNTINTMNEGAKIVMHTDYIPEDDNDLITKVYLDTYITDNNVNDATTTIKGIIQLAGDLTGTASLPTIANNTISTNKMANLNNLTKLLGSNDTSTAVTEIDLGNNISISNNILNFITVKKFKKIYKNFRPLTIQQNEAIKIFNISYPDTSLLISSSTDSEINISQNTALGYFSISFNKNSTTNVYVRFTINLAGIITENCYMIYKMYDKGTDVYFDMPSGVISTQDINTTLQNSNMTFILTVPPTNFGTTLLYDIRSFEQNPVNIVFDDINCSRSCYIEEL